MFRKLIVGVDGRQGGSDAVALAKVLAAPDAEIVLVNAFPYENFPSRGSLQGYEALLRDDSNALLRKEDGDARFSRLSVADVSPGRALHEEAEKVNADLIVIASCHHGVIGRVLVGDVSRSVLHGAPCPVAVAPLGYRESAGEIRTIGVGFDDSDQSRAAVDAAGEIATDRKAAVRLLSVMSIPVSFAPVDAYSHDWSQIKVERRMATDQALQRAAAGLSASVSGDILDGEPAKELEKLSENVDLMVVGSRGWGSAKRVALGSTSDRLVHHAACPVLIITSPATDRGADAEQQLVEA